MESKKFSQTTLFQNGLRMRDVSTPNGHSRKIELTPGFKIYESNQSENSVKAEHVVKLVKKLSKSAQKEVETNCDLENEISQEDQELIDFLTQVKTLGDEQLKLIGTNNEEFWEKCAEAIRVDLKENLDDNEQLHEIADWVEQEHRELTTQNAKLSKMADEASEILNSIMQKASEIDDSGVDN